mmetsp:Transcript_70179/g.111372  ORF Transcript_70179/g.111372 Transcript_70179/m.111372 type:complete len:133 (+) Transcript_70179:77-475(+)
MLFQTFALPSQVVRMMICLSLLTRAVANKFDIKDPPECVKLEGTQEWFKLAKWEDGMIFRKETAITSNPGDVSIYYKSVKKSERCFYPDPNRQDWMRTTSEAYCQRGGLGGKGFHYLAPRSWEPTKCSHDEL